jgi:dTDP-4-dehydrorhamnose 3,5-epimerase
MKIIETNIKDLLIIEPSVFKDDRGWFSESYNKEKLKLLGISINFIQDNHSLSLEKGTIRGLHLQTNPNAQTKLVRCTKGRILDVAVDLRKSSPTYLKAFTIELSTVNQKQLLIPKGFAHGFVTLEDNTEVQYKVDEYYSKEHDRSIKYNDPIFNIDWVVDNVILSDKDKNAPFYRDSDISFE